MNSWTGIAIAVFLLIVISWLAVGLVVGMLAIRKFGWPHEKTIVRLSLVIFIWPFALYAMEVWDRQQALRRKSANSDE